MIHQIPKEDVDRVIDVLCEAFYHYPVMRYVLGPETDDFDDGFRRLIRLFVMARVLSGDPLLGIEGEDGLVAAAAITLPDSRGTQELADYRKETWARFEPGARERYAAFCDACYQFEEPDSHHHLNMIGVRRNWQGKGLARKLIEKVIHLSNRDPASGGVSLSTESSQNVPFYEHMGFVVTGHAVVGPGLETWNFYRPKNPA